MTVPLFHFLSQSSQIHAFAFIFLSALATARPDSVNDMTLIRFVPIESDTESQTELVDREV